LEAVSTSPVACSCTEKTEVAQARREGLWHKVRHTTMLGGTTEDLVPSSRQIYRSEWILQNMSFEFRRVDATALQAVKVDGTGQQFTRFVNSLISSEAFFSDLPPSEVHLNPQTNLHDGGADAAVSRPLPHDRTGWMQRRPAASIPHRERASVSASPVSKFQNHLLEGLLAK
jgi:hypothetical protein